MGLPVAAAAAAALAVSVTAAVAHRSSSSSGEGTTNATCHVMASGYGQIQGSGVGGISGSNDINLSLSEGQTTTVPLTDLVAWDLGVDVYMNIQCTASGGPPLEFTNIHLQAIALDDGAVTKPEN